jgi:hypothetical protein
MKITLQSFCWGFFLAYGIYMLSYLPLRHSQPILFDRGGVPCIVFTKDKQWIYALYQPAMWLDTRITRTQFYLSEKFIEREGHIPQ